MDLPVTVSYGSIIYVVDDKKRFMISGIHLKSLDGKNGDPIKTLINDSVEYKYIKLICVQDEIGKVMGVFILILFLSGNCVTENYFVMGLFTMKQN